MSLKKFDSINVIPFIDIMLVLLVIVLTTATFISKGLLEVSLVKTSSTTKIDIQKELVITIKNDESIFLDKEEIEMDLLQIKLKTFSKRTPIILNCDKNIAFGKFVYILDILKNGNFNNFFILTQNE